MGAQAIPPASLKGYYCANQANWIEHDTRNTQPRKRTLFV